jgi:hypothetical protein
MPHIGQQVDDVRGIIIGGNFVSWQLFYDGRHQSGLQYADNSELAESQARSQVAEMRAKYKDEFKRLYPDESKWEMRIWG